MTTPRTTFVDWLVTNVVLAAYEVLMSR